MFAVTGKPHGGKWERQSFSSGPEVGQHQADCLDSKSKQKKSKPLTGKARLFHASSHESGVWVKIP